MAKELDGASAGEGKFAKASPESPSYAPSVSGDCEYDKMLGGMPKVKTREEVAKDSFPKKAPGAAGF